MGRMIEHYLLLPFIIVGYLVNGLIRPLVGFGCQHIAFLISSGFIYWLVRPHWDSILQILRIR